MRRAGAAPPERGARRGRAPADAADQISSCRTPATAMLKVIVLFAAVAAAAAAPFNATVGLGDWLVPACLLPFFNFKRKKEKEKTKRIKR